jgi:hypothetical protein
MSDQQGNLSVSPPPPKAVLKVMNLVMRPLLTSAVAKRVKGVMLLEFTGRRTGRVFKVPVNFHLVHGVPMAFTEAPWRLNFTGGAPLTVTYRGQVHHTTGTLVPMTPEEMGIAVRESLDHGGSAQRMGIRIPRGYEPSATDLAQLGPALGSSAIRLDFEP